MSKKNRGGFTLIELSLSLIFIAILSLTVVLLIQNISVSYRRGLILNQVNTIGMDLIEDFRTSIQNAATDPVSRTCEIYYPDHDASGNDYDDYTNCVNDHAKSFVSVQRRAKVKVEGNSVNAGTSYGIPVYGAFCTGTYTYVWNSGYFEGEDDSDRIDFAGTTIGNLVGKTEVISAEPATVGTKRNPEKYKNFRLLKIYDDERTICANVMEVLNGTGSIKPYHKIVAEDNSKIKNQFTIGSTNDDDFEAVEVLKKDKASDLAIYELFVGEPAISSTRENAFYSISFILGTRRGGINISQTGKTCKPPNDIYSELEYCAINKFNFAVMAGGF